MTDALKVLRGALLWARNHIDLGVLPPHNADEKATAQITAVLDKVLEDCGPVSGDDVRMFRNAYLKKEG